MPEDAILTLRIDSELRDQVLAEAEASQLPVSQVVGDVLRDYVDRRRAAREHDSWFRDAVEEGLRDSRDPSVSMLSHADVMAEWHAEQDELHKLIGNRD